MAKTLFDHLNAIFTDQSIDYFDTLDASDQKTYSVYMVNRLISMNVAYLDLVNEFQPYLNIVGSRESYLFYSQMLPKGRQFNKYIKPSGAVKHDDAIIKIVVTHYQVSKRDAMEYIRVLMASELGRDELRDVLITYGLKSTKIKF